LNPSLIAALQELAALRPFVGGRPLRPLSVTGVTANLNAGFFRSSPHGGASLISVMSFQS